MAVMESADDLNGRSQRTISTASLSGAKSSPLNARTPDEVDDCLSELGLIGQRASFNVALVSIALAEQDRGRRRSTGYLSDIHADVMYTPPRAVYRT